MKKISDHHKFDFSFLSVDVHSHLLPGLDDGVQTDEESLFLFQRMQTLGFRKLICTPHIFQGVYDNHPSEIVIAVNKIKNILKAEGIMIEVEAGVEYMVDDEFELLLKDKKNILNWGNNHVLIEMSYVAPSSNLYQIIFRLAANGYQPVLAHPERYSYWLNDFKIYRDIRDRGCLLQLNLLSLTGYYGNDVKKTANDLIQNGLIDLAGTDVHGLKHLKVMEQMLDNTELMQKLKDYPFMNNEL